MRTCLRLTVVTAWLGAALLVGAAGCGSLLGLDDPAMRGSHDAATDAPIDPDDPDASPDPDPEQPDAAPQPDATPQPDAYQVDAQLPDAYQVDATE